MDIHGVTVLIQAEKDANKLIEQANEDRYLLY